MKKSPLFIIFLVVFIDLLGFGIIIPNLPLYAKSYGASGTTLGFLMASYSTMQFFFSPFWGRLSDRYGRRPIILLSILGVGLSMFILGQASSLLWLFIGRTLAGIFGANISAASAYIADVTSPKDRAKGMGLIGAGFGLGFTMGPFLGAVLSQWGYGMAAYAAGCLSMANFIFAYLRLKEPETTHQIRKEHRSHASWDLKRKILGNPQAGLAILIFFIVTFAFGQLETAFAFYMKDFFELDARGSGTILGMMGLIMVLIQGGGIRKLVPKYGEVRLTLIGTGLMAITLLLSTFTFSLQTFVIILLFNGIGFAITNPSISSLASRSVSEEIQGITMGTYQSAGSLARIFAPVTAGFLYDHIKPAPFRVAALLFALACLLVGMKGKVWESLKIKG